MYVFVCLFVLFWFFVLFLILFFYCFSFTLHYIYIIPQELKQLCIKKTTTTENNKNTGYIQNRTFLFHAKQNFPFPCITLTTNKNPVAYRQNIIICKPNTEIQGDQDKYTISQSTLLPSFCLWYHLMGQNALSDRVRTHFQSMKVVIFDDHQFFH